MLRLVVSVTIILLAWSLLDETTVPGEENHDVTFSTPYESGEPTTANFYFNDRAIGKGREGFAEIVEWIDKLPPGTSVVWGPNYARCGACSGAEPNCVPKFLYPDLWQKLETSVTKHHLILSSTYPGPHLRPSFNLNIPRAMPVPLLADDPEAKQHFDAILDWEVGEVHRSGNAHSGQPTTNSIVGGRFLSAGKVITDFDLELFFGRLAEHCRVLIRLSWSGKTGLPREGDRLISLAKQIRAAWPLGVNEELERGRLTAVLTVPAPLVEALKTEKSAEEKQQRLAIEWSNFHGPNTPTDEVLYCLNGRFIGRGNEAFQYILAEIDKLQPHAEVIIPRYKYSGRWAIESFSQEELDKKNVDLRGFVPFAARCAELDAAIAKRNLTVNYLPMSPGEATDTVMDWHSGDRYGSSFVSFGRIVRYDERPGPAAAKLGWTNYETVERNGKRQVESQAVYTLNDVKIGKGVAGFAKAMEKLGKLPEGSVVQVRVCLRTKGSFTCPLIYAGHRHFERTGFEPYVGMFPWLVDAVKKRKLELQWIPDEKQSCGDCELNK